MQETRPQDEQDDQFSEHLEALDEAIAAGTAEALSASTPVHLRDRLLQAQSCLELLGQTRPASAAGANVQAIGRFRIIRELGRGGCGVVFLASDPMLRRDVALKVPLPEILATTEFRHRFLREARAAAQLSHPNVVAVYESGEVGPIAYIASAYSAGTSLAKWLKEHQQPVAPRAAAALVQVLARAVHHCHTKGVVHRDLKPGNILLELNEEQGAKVASASEVFSSFIPKITDFGLARWESSSGGDKTRPGTVMGTAAYMAPEQAQSLLEEIGPHTDVYALGAILFELLAGQPPFRGTNELDTMLRVIGEEPPPLCWFRNNVHGDLETICRKCLEKKPHLRYASAEELALDLERFCQGEAILARPTGRLERAKRWCRRHPTTVSLLALISLTLLIVLPSWLSYERSLRESSRRQRLAEQSASQEQQARAAAELHANTQRYFGLLNRLRQRSNQKLPGWTWAGLDDLSELSRIKTEARNIVDLRSEAATLLAGVDLREKTVLTDSFSAYCLAFSSDGHYLAAGQHLAQAFLWAPIRVYDLRGSVRFELAYPLKLVKLNTGLAPDGAVCLSFSADGKHLAVGTRSGHIHCWDLTAKEPARVSWQGAATRIHELAFHPHQPVVYSVSYRDRFIKRWDAATGKELARMEAAKGHFHGMSLHKDGKKLACILDDKITYLDADSLRDLNWSRKNDERLGLFSLCCSPDGRFLAVQAEDGMLMLLAEGGPEVRRFAFAGSESAHRGGINRLEFSRDGRLLLSASENEKDRTLRIWEVASGRLLAGAVLGQSGPLAFALHPHGRIVATAADHRVTLQELAGGDVETFCCQHPHKIQSASFSADGAWMAVGGECIMPERIAVHFLSVCQTASDQVVRTHYFTNDEDKPSWQPLVHRFHPGEPILAAAGWSHNVWLFDPKEKLRPMPARDPVLLAFDRDGKKLWTVLDERTVQSRNWPDGKVASTHQPSSLQRTGREQIYCVEAGRRWVLCGGRDGQTRLLHAEDGKLHSTWPGPDVPIRSVAISAAESWAAVGSQDGIVRIMSLPDGKVLGTLQDHAGSVDGLAIDAADRFMVTCSTENRVHIYALQGGLPRLYATLTLPTGPVRGLCFHPGGKQFACISGKETAVRLWNLAKLQERFAELGLP